jgi:hypothetical protein
MALKFGSSPIETVIELNGTVDKKPMNPSDPPDVLVGLTTPLKASPLDSVILKGVAAPNKPDQAQLDAAFAGRTRTGPAPFLLNSPRTAWRRHLTEVMEDPSEGSAQ